MKTSTKQATTANQGMTSPPQFEHDSNKRSQIEITVGASPRRSSPRLGTTSRVDTCTEKVSLFPVLVPTRECDHEDTASFRMQDNSAYFAKAFLDKNPSAVRACALCAAQFGTAYKVSSKTPIYACSNADKTQHPCMFAVCYHCYSHRNVFGNNSQEQGRTSRRRNAGQPAAKL